MATNLDCKNNNYCLVYFSGTGNTKFLAEEIGKGTKSSIYSIEDDVDWKDIFRIHENIIFMYPIHYSVPPLFFRNFLEENRRYLENKKVASIISQMCYSGDGARVIEDYLPDSCEVFYTRHFNMPDNISNIDFLNKLDFGKKRKIRKSLKRTKRVIKDLNSFRHSRRHCSSLSIWMGEAQRKPALKKESDKQSNVWIDDNCIKCGICVKVCPVENLKMGEKKPENLGKCTFCLRCQNKCPKKSISILSRGKVVKPYNIKDYI